MKVKRYILLGTMTLLLAMLPAHGALSFTETFSGVDTAIPNGNPVGVTLTGAVSDIPAGLTVGGVTVELNVSGGYNGALYAYLIAPNGTLVVLMNQPGTDINGMGAGGAGLNITLQDGATANGSIQNETSDAVLSGSYNAAGTLADFNGSAADGTWTLYFADLASGGGTSEVNGWSLGITAVPEPANVALIIFGAGSGLFSFVRWCRRGERPGRNR